MRWIELVTEAKAIGTVGAALPTRPERIVRTVIKDGVEYRLIEAHIYLERLRGDARVYRVEAWHDGRKVGNADFDERDRAWGVWVEGGKDGGQNYRRRRIATAMYDLMSEHLGKPVEPASSAQSRDAKAFWANRNSVKEARRTVGAARSRQSVRFIRQLHQATKSLPIRAALEPFPAGGANAVLLTDLFADQPGAGAGTTFMTELAKLADDAGIAVFTMPDTPRNRQFYERFDFALSSRMPGYMARFPAPPAWLSA